MYSIYTIIVVTIAGFRYNAVADLSCSSVQVQEGELEGLEVKSPLTGKLYCSFLGVPYAKPPTGDLRFKAPEPIEKWDGVFHATKEAAVCIQMNRMKNSILVGNEDCLVLNIYAPKVISDTEDKKAVMIFFHGGGFHTESSIYYGPVFLINYDVILVTVNYRLHVLGFLNTGTKSCPGNAGMKDQSLAIKWVKKNIANFGGDPDNITLFGESAGGISVHLQMLSPLSNGLFKRAIIQSGTALSPWAIQPDPELKALEIGRLAGYEGDDLEGLVQHLRNEVTAEKLTELAHQCKEDIIRNTPGHCRAILFSPSVEKIKEGAFLPDSVENLMKLANPLPTIVGLNNQEGLLFYLVQGTRSMDTLLNDISIVVKNNFNLNDVEQAELLTEIKRFYFKNEPISIPQVVNLYSDLYFMKFHEAFDHLTQSNVPPYMYLFVHDGDHNYRRGNRMYKACCSDIEGASHGDELRYLFGRTVKPDMNETDKEVVDHICTLWTNFAKTGNPTASLPQIDWKPNTNSHPRYIQIDETLKVFNNKLNEESFNFWRKWSAKFQP